MNKVFARVLIKEKKGNILVIKDRDDTWNFPGGKQEENETTIDCAKREVKEEIGIEVLEMHQVCKSSFIFEETKWDGYFYFATSVRGVPCMNEPEKIKEIKYVSNYDVASFPKEMEATTISLFQYAKMNNLKTAWK